MEQVWLDQEQGLHALLRDVKDVSERQRRPIVEMLKPDQEPDLATMNRVFDALIMALVVSWNRPETFNADALLDLPGSQYDALRNAVLPKLQDITPNFGVSPDENSPTDTSKA